jgi:hypothetical protein
MILYIYVRKLLYRKETTTQQKQKPSLGGERGGMDFSRYK